MIYLFKPHRLYFILLIFIGSYTYGQKNNKERIDLILSHSSQNFINEGNTIPGFIEFNPNYSPELSEIETLLNSFSKSKFQLKQIKKETDQLGVTHRKFQQFINSIPCELNFVTVHSQNGNIRKLSGNLVSQIPSNSFSILTKKSALKSALNHINAKMYKWELPVEEAFIKELHQDPNKTFYPKGQLVYLFLQNELILAYKFNIYAHEPISRADYYVDAKNGRVVFINQDIHHADVTGTAHTGYSGTRSIQADSISTFQYRLRESGRGNGIETYDMNNGKLYGSSVDFNDSNNIWTSTTNNNHYALDAHWGAEMTYDYFWNVHSRNSIDGLGFKLSSYVHYDNNYINAFWDGTRMTYGDGNGTSITPLTTLAIAGHEISHGLTSKTANLIYAFESGALNESFSDIFGLAIDFWARPTLADWKIGDEIFASGGNYFRSMSNPKAKGDPDTYLGINYYLGTADYGGVHTNSGVQNYWFYLLANGGSGVNDNGDAYSVTGLGLDVASKIAFRNLTVYLGRNSQFSDARFYSIMAAKDLYGPCSNEVIATTNAWYAVGVGPAYIPGVIAGYQTIDSVGCKLPHTVVFRNVSNNAVSYSWDFGDGNSSTAMNPVHTYTSGPGPFHVTLLADGGACGKDTLTKLDNVSIDSTILCPTILTRNSSLTSANCKGILIDDGGNSANYSANQTSTFLISPAASTRIELTVNFFDVESGSTGTICNYDYLEVYDGTNSGGVLLGKYCNNNLPPNSLISLTGNVFIVFHSDGGLEEGGFTIEWNSYSQIDTTIEACNSFYWSQTNQNYLLSGIYIDTLTNAQGCDSIVTLNLTINNSNTGVDVQTACDSYTWINGVTYTSSNNTATDTLTNTNGCDSVVTLNLTINNSTTGTDVQIACDSYTWINGVTYTSSNNTATDTLTNAAGCDSIVKLNLTINNSNTGVDIQTACDSYTWINGVTYTSSNNTATDTLTNTNGCDSVVTLNLTINNSTTGTDVQIACDSYTWINGVTYTSSNNTTTDTLTNAAGCDSIVKLNLTINNSNTGVDIQTACYSYTWINGVTYISSNNTATDTLTNAQGCDSIVTLNLTINNSNTGVDIQTACDSYTWINGVTYTNSNNTATDTLTNAAGCDSIVTLNLTINNSNTGIDLQTACDSYTWINGVTYTSSNNTATDTLTNAAGCDSIVKLNLTINNSNTATDVQTACDSYTWINGVTYTSSNNTATDTLTNTNGCDSVVTLNLTINNSTTGTDVQIACDSYTWINGVTYTSSNNTATDTLTNTNGCDSVVTLNLTINNSTTGTDVQTACDSYTWINGVTYTSSNNTATDTLTNTNGCDSVVTLNLTINNSTTGTDVQIACDSYTWINGVTYTSSNNTATDTLTNAAGCDSIAKLNLTINNSNTGVDIQTACDSYTWINGVTYTSSNNTATDTLTNAAGCNSIVTLNLTINNSNTATDVQTTCDSYTWINGVNYTSSNNTATDTLTNTNGCDSVVTLNLTINNSTTGTDVQIACDSYTWINGVTYTNSNNTATDTLTNAAGCDSIVTLNLTINNSNTGVDIQTACDSYTWINGVTYISSNNTATDTLTNAAGCDSVVTLNLTINNSTTGTDVITACDSYTWINGVTYTNSNNTATDTLTNAAGCDSVVTLNLTINNSSTGVDIQTACDSYTWINGVTYTNSNNTATDTLTNSAGCDSIVTLNLTINNSNTGIDLQTACDSYTWINGVTYTSSNNTATDTLTNTNGCDSVVTLNLTINNSTTGTDVQTACDSYTWINGVTYTSSNNTATDTLTNAQGCDSIVTLNLTINPSAIITNQPANQTVFVGGIAQFQVTATGTGLTYQWQEDDGSGYNNLTSTGIYSGSSTNTLTISGVNASVQQNGYRCRISNSSGCSDTTLAAILYISLTSIDENGVEESFKLFPNPTTSELNIETTIAYTSGSIINALGQTVIQFKNEKILDVSHLKTGNYILVIKGGNKEVIKTEKFNKY